MKRIVSLFVLVLLCGPVSADDWIDFISQESVDTQYAEAKGMPGNLETASTTKDKTYVASGNLLFNAPRTWVAGAESETKADHTYGATLLGTSVEHSGQVDTGGDPAASPVRSGRATSRGEITSERVLVSVTAGIANGQLSINAYPDGCDIEGGYTLEGYVYHMTIGGHETGICAVWASYDATEKEWFVQWVDEDGWDSRTSATPVKVLSFSHQMYSGDRLAFEGTINGAFFKEELGSPTDRNPEAQVIFTADTDLQ